MALSDYFGFFDPKQAYSTSFGWLPHWDQPGATYFITFRLADSLPQALFQRWRREQVEWLRRRGLYDPTRSRLELLAAQPLDIQREFHRQFAAMVEKELDQGYGECVLRRPELARVVGDSLLHFDGIATSSQPGISREIRYHLSDFVVMPNHVHVLVCFLRHVRLKEQCHSWKHFTANRINRLLGRKGALWQSESFDHLVRDANHFQRFRNYIASNPIRAGLNKPDYLHYQLDM